jgi:hypothetical protein
MYAPLTSPMRATCPAHLILLALITLTILGEETEKSKVLNTHSHLIKSHFMSKIWNNANPKKLIKFLKNRIISKLPGRVNFKLFTLLPHGGATLAGEQKYPPSFFSIVWTTEKLVLNYARSSGKHPSHKMRPPL